MRLLVIAIVSTALLAVAAGASAAPAKDDYQLKGEVYPNALYKIEMENKAGKELRGGEGRHVSHQDRGQGHDPQLPPAGPGVNRATSVAGKAETIWTVRLRKGTYRFLCDPHAASMGGSFRVT